MDNLKLPDNASVAKKLIESNNELERLKIDLDREKSKNELGTLGKFFGSGNSISKNIAGLTIIVLLSIGIIYTLIFLFKEQRATDISIKEFWGVILPLLTLTIGYLFGKSKE